MTVAELIAKLQEFPPDTPVFTGDYGTDEPEVFLQRRTTGEVVVL